MNSLVAAHRQSYPNDPRSDDAITLAYAQADPAAFNNWPDAAQDYGRITGQAAAQSAGVEPESAFVSGLREVGENILPAGATALGALGAGAAASETGPGAIPAAIAGGTAVGGGARYLQDLAEKGLLGEEGFAALKAQEEANRKAHPIATKIGEFLGQAPEMLGGRGLAKAAGVADDVVEEVVQKALRAGMSKSAALAAGEAAREYSLGAKLMENSASGAIMSGSGAAQAKVEGQDVTIPGEIIKGAVTMGPIGFLPAAKSVFGAIGWKAPTDAAVLGLSNALYDHFVKGAPIDPKALAENIGTDIPGFMLMNGLTAFFHLPFVPTKDGLTSKEAGTAGQPAQPAQTTDAAQPAGQPAEAQFSPLADGSQEAKPAPAPAQFSPADDSINPASAYHLTEEHKDILGELAQRVASGDASPEVQTAVLKNTSQMPDGTPNNIRAESQVFYETELKRLKEEAATRAAAAAPAEEAAPPQAAAPAAPTAAPVVNPESRVPAPPEPARTPVIPVSAPTPAAPEVQKGREALAQAAPVKKTGWQKRQADPEELINKAGFGTAQVKDQGAAEAGRKQAQAYTDFEHDGITAPKDEIFKDSKAEGGDNMKTRKLVVARAKDGSHVIVASAYINKGVAYVTGLKGKGIQYSDFLKEYEPIASVKTDEATKGYAVTYSPEQWHGIRDTLFDMRQKARGTYTGGQEYLEKTAEYGRQSREAEKDAMDAGASTRGGIGAAEEGEDVQTKAAGQAEQSNPVEVKGLTAAHAEAIFKAVDGLPKDREGFEAGFLKALGSSKMPNATRAAIQLAIRSLLKAGHSVDDAAAILEQKIYESHTSGDSVSKEAFTRSLLQGLHSRDAESPRPERANAGRAEAGALEAGRGEAAGERAEVERAADDVNTNPTEAQKEAGNCKKGHVTLDGDIEVAIENPKGSTRSKEKGGKTLWSVEMPAHYGQILGVEGAEKGENGKRDLMDIYLGKHPESDKVFVVDQKDPRTGKFQEHKVMYGFHTAEEARKTYEAAFNDGSGASRIGAITELSKDDFHDWVQEGDTHRALAMGKEREPVRFSVRGKGKRKDRKLSPRRRRR